MLSKAEQLKKIKEIMGNGADEIPHYRFTFGKHQNKTLDYVIENDRQYLLWLYNEYENLPKVVEDFVEKSLLNGYH